MFNLKNSNAIVLSKLLRNLYATWTHLQTEISNTNPLPNLTQSVLFYSLEDQAEKFIAVSFALPYRYVTMPSMISILPHHMYGKILNKLEPYSPMTSRPMPQSISRLHSMIYMISTGGFDSRLMQCVSID